MKITVPPSRARRSWRGAAPHGFTLLEVLVAIVVLSFGVLGVVGLQAMALQANKEARYQSTAVALARELGDMMRSTKNIAMNSSPAQNPYLIDFSNGAFPAAPSDCFAAACGSQLAVAQFNMREWLVRVNQAVPGVRVVVCFDTQPFDSDGRPRWACDDDSTTLASSGKASVVKIGWTRQSTNVNADDAERVTNGGTAPPSVVMPLIPGNTL